MPKVNRLKVWNTVGLGFKIPHLNRSIFIPSALNSAISSIFFFFTVAFYQPGEAPGAMQDLTGILTPGQYWLFFLLTILISGFAGLVIAKMAYDSIAGKPAINDAVSLAARKFLPYIAVSILYSLIVGVGTVLLILPGIFFGVKLVFCSYFILFDDKGVFSSLAASWQMLKGNWWRVFVLLLIWGIIVIVPTMFFVYLPRAAETVAYFVFYLLLTPWIMASTTAAYLHLRGSGEEEVETPALS